MSAMRIGRKDGRRGDLPTAKPAIRPTTTASGIEVAGRPSDTLIIINSFHLNDTE